MRPTKTQHSEAGFTLLELLLVVGVGALLLIGGIATYRLVSEGNKVAETTRLVMTIRNEASTLAQGQGYDGVETALSEAKIVTSTTKNAFGGALTVTGAPTTLTVKVDGLPPNACRKLAMAIREQGIKVQGKTGGFDKVGDVSGCGSAGDANSVEWIFQ